MRPDPPRLPVRRSTNACSPMLLGPQRYAVVHLAIWLRCRCCHHIPACCEWYPRAVTLYLLAGWLRTAHTHRQKWWHTFPLSTEG